MYNCTHLRLDENKNMTLLRGRAGEGVDEGAWDDGVDKGEGGDRGGGKSKLSL